MPAKTRELVDRIDDRLRAEHMPDPLRMLLHTCSYILLGMRYDDGVIQPAFLGVEGMKESTTYQAIIREGMQLGRQEGRLQSVRDNLKRVLRKRFGTIPAALEARIDAATDVAALEDALLQAISIDKPEDLVL